MLAQAMSVCGSGAHERWRSQGRPRRTEAELGGGILRGHSESAVREGQPVALCDSPRRKGRRKGEKKNDEEEEDG